MKIYFDISTLNPERVTGVGVYMLQLYKQLRGIRGVEVVPVLKLSRFRKRKSLEKFLGGASVQLLFPWSFFSKGISLYHGPDFKINTEGSFPKIVTIHDMVVFEQKYNAPEFYKQGMADLKRVLPRHLDAVIVNSEFTKQQVLKYFPHLKNHIHVTYLGCDRVRDESVPVESNSSARKYILFLGTLEKRKNVLGVIRAFEILKAKGDFSHQLILAGAWGYGSDEIKQALEDSPVKSDIVHLSYVRDEDVKSLYKNASVFFFPSHYEGFGIPVLEAMSLGVPVVISSGGVLEEITAGAALSALAEDYAGLAEQLQHLLDDPELRQQKIAEGLAQAKKFTWEKCALETLQIYKKVLKAKR